MTDRPEAPAGPAPEKPAPGVFARVGLALGPVVFLALAFGPTPLASIEGFGRRPAYAAGVAALMAVWWFTEALPIAVTACLPLLLYPALGVFGQGPLRDAGRAAEPFVDAYVFLFLGGMTIGAAMEEHGLHRRVALHIMRAIGTEPRRLLLGMLVATASVSLWISNTATAVMMLPIGLALMAQLEKAAGGRRLPHFGSAIMLSIAYASNVGGIGTKIGTGTNSIFCGFVAEHLGRDIDFLRYIAFAFPFVVLFVPVVWGALWLIARSDDIPGGGGAEAISSELAAMGSMSRAERKVASVFGAAAILWIFGDPIRQALAPRVSALLGGAKILGKHYEATVALGAALALILLGVLSRKAIRRIPWGTLILLGGSFALAAGIEGSGLSKWIAAQLSGVQSMSLFAQIALASFSTVALSAIASNTAAVNVALNVLPQSMPVLGATAIAASCDFMLPAGTPPNAIVFGSGYIRLPTMMKIGFFLDVAAASTVTLYAYFWVRWIL